MSPEQLYHDADLARYYDVENPWSDDLAYCSGLMKGRRSLLDLGCGTGLLAATVAATGKRSVGVDPAGAMLDIARSRPGGDKAVWIAGDARDVRLGERFDLVTMTGHAFQVFLTRADRLSVLKTIAAHLAPEGSFIFDSRNPEREEWREWTPDRSLRQFTHPHLGEVTAWEEVSQDPATGIVTYRTSYRRHADDAIDTAAARLAFAPRAEIAGLLDEAGLRAQAWLGDWNGVPWAPDSREIVVVGGLR